MLILIACGKLITVVSVACVSGLGINIQKQEHALWLIHRVQHEINIINGTKTTTKRSFNHVRMRKPLTGSMKPALLKPPATKIRFNLLLAGCILLFSNIIYADGNSAQPTVKQIETYVFGHNCALLGDGTVQCWGRNGGRLGDGTRSFRPTPVFVNSVENDGKPLMNVIELSEGDAASHTCALLEDCRVVCWGSNTFGQLGSFEPDEVRGDFVSSLTPVYVQDAMGRGDLRGVSQVVTAANTSCALMTDSRVKCWGSADRGILGSSDELTEATGPETDRDLFPFSTTPVMVQNPTADGDLIDIVRLYAGSTFICALTKSSEAVCWGWNFYGQLGDSTPDESSAVPVYARAANGEKLDNIKQLGATATSTCALFENGTVSCWGSNNSGQLGDGTLTDSPTPVDVLSADGDLEPLKDVEQIESGFASMCAVLSQGRPVCWGLNLSGALGNGDTNSTSVPVTTSVPVAVKNPSGRGQLSNVKQISLSLSSACAVKENHKDVFCWGRSFSIGDGSDENSALPRPVLFITNAPEIVTPSPDGLLTGSTVDFVWQDNGNDIVQWYFRIGSTEDGDQYANARIRNSAQRSATFSGLPTDGSRVYVEFSYQLSNGAWIRSKLIYDAAGGLLPELVSPAAGSQLDGSDVTFQWTNDDPSVQQYYFRVGRSPGAAEYAEMRFINPAIRQFSLQGLPVDGSTVHVEFSYYRDGAWITRNLTYHAARSDS
ncbi:MAG: RCC1 domain-containing protein [Granulosicoccus sp.]